MKKLQTALLTDDGFLHFLIPDTNGKLEVVDLEKSDRDAENLKRAREAVQRASLGGYWEKN